MWFLRSELIDPSPFGWIVGYLIIQWFAMAFLVENLHGGVFEFIHQFSWRPIWRLPQFPRCHSGIDMPICRGSVTLSHAPSMAHHQAMNQPFIPRFGWSRFPNSPWNGPSRSPLIKQHLSNNRIYETDSLDITSSCHSPPFQNICSLGNPECSLSM
jgi:hypothetical protein